MKPDVLRVREPLGRATTRPEAPCGPRTASRSACRAGERLGIAGESGSGKSTIALSLLRLIKPPGRIESGEIWLDGQDLMTLSDDEMRRLRLARIALVPQGSMNSLNPVLRIRDQIADALRDHGVAVAERQLDAAAARPPPAGRPRARGRRHVPPPAVRRHEAARLHRHRHQPPPRVIVADEPTSALDVVVQRQVMDTLGAGPGRSGRLGHPGRPRHGADGAVRRPARRHVRRQAGRDLAGPRRLRGAAPPLHPDAHRQPALARAEGRVPGHPRAPAAAPRPAPRLRVPSPLPAGRRALPHGEPALREARPDAWAACHLA